MNADERKSLNGSGRATDQSDVGHIIDFPEKKSWRRSKNEKQRPPRQPLINLPPATKALIALFVAIHVALHLLAPQFLRPAVETFGFIPARYSGQAPFTVWALIAPVTYAFLHGGWLHLALNGVMMAALGTGAERWLGGGRMLVLFLLCSAAGALCQFALSPASPAPMIGASAGISGLFAAAVVMMQPLGDPRQRRGLLPFILLWVAVSAAFGLMGGPDGSPVAWAAHIGGFLAGFVALKVLKIQ